MGTLRTISSAAVTYQSTYNNGFPQTFAIFGGPPPGTCALSNLLDSTLTANGQKSGYTISYTQVTALTAAATGCGSFFGFGNVRYGCSTTQRKSPPGNRTFWQRRIRRDPRGSVGRRRAGHRRGLRSLSGSAVNILKSHFAKGRKIILSPLFAFLAKLCSKWQPRNSSLG